MAPSNGPPPKGRKPNPPPIPPPLKCVGVVRRLPPAVVNPPVASLIQSIDTGARAHDGSLKVRKFVRRTYPKADYSLQPRQWEVVVAGFVDNVAYIGDGRVYRSLVSFSTLCNRCLRAGYAEVVPAAADYQAALSALELAPEGRTPHVEPLPPAGEPEKRQGRVIDLGEI